MSAQFRAGADGPIPNVELPTQVIAGEGQLTLFADFANPGKNCFPLYLVNRTDKPVAIPSQDGGLYLKLTYETADGYWQRAQSHTSSDCGNSYFPLILSPGQHFKTLGYQPKTGHIGKSDISFTAG